MPRWQVTYKIEHSGKREVTFNAGNFEEASARARMAIELSTGDQGPDLIILKLEEHSW